MMAHRRIQPGDRYTRLKVLADIGHGRCSLINIVHETNIDAHALDHCAAAHTTEPRTNTQWFLLRHCNIERTPTPMRSNVSNFRFCGLV